MPITMNNVTIGAVTIADAPYNLANVILIYDTSKEANNQVTLPIFENANVLIDWGDNSTTSYSNFFGGFISHTYSSTGNYIVNISGHFERFGALNTPPNNVAKLTQIISFGNVGLKSLSGAVVNANNLISLPNSIPNTVTSLIFFAAESNATNSAYANIINWNTANVEIMEFVFNNNSTFNQPIGNWNTSNVFKMGGMFLNSVAFNQPLDNWDVSNVEANGMNFMFSGATSFNQDLTDWCVINVDTQPTAFASDSLDANNYPIWGTCP